MVLALLGYAVLVSVGVPAAFGLAGPVVERRGLHAFAFATATAIAWGASLSLGFLSLGAAGAAIATLSTLLLLAAGYSWSEERLLARFDARIGSGARQEALEEIHQSVETLARAGRRPVAPMQTLGFAVRRLIAHGYHEDALELLDRIDERLGDRVGPADASEARLLRVRVALQLGRIDDARRTLAADRRRQGDETAEAQLLADLLEICGTDRASRPLPRPPEPSLWSAWLAALARLVRAHVAAARGDDATAARDLRALRSAPYGTVTLELAHTLPGPASELARQIQGAPPPYR